MNNSELISGDATALTRAGLQGVSTVMSDEEGQKPLRQALTMICAAGGVVRDIVFVTIDALRGRYDH